MNLCRHGTMRIKYYVEENSMNKQTTKDFFKDKNHDLDSSMDAWEKLYMIIYKDTFGKVFAFDTVDELCDCETKKIKRWYAKINSIEYRELRNQYKQFKIAGDCDFNFKGRNRLYFEKLLRKEYCGTELERYLNLLNECEDNLHSLFNFSFMPITGGMNNKKQMLTRFDRPDKFICYLNQYFEARKITVEGQNVTSKVLPSVYSKNRPALVWYLSLFNDIYDYCEKIYLLDGVDGREIVDKMLEQGEQPINDGKRVVDYMNLAELFWKKKKAKLKKAKVKF